MVRIETHSAKKVVPQEPPFLMDKNEPADAYLDGYLD
jgi:hypothetical protein